MTIELDIIRLFDTNLRGFYTINAIATELDKAYPFIHRKVHALIEIGVLRSVQVGKSHCCSINLKSRRAILYLTELELEKRPALPAATQTLVKQLEADGTLAIETAVYGNGTVYMIGSGTYPGTVTITPEAFKELLLTTPLFKDHVVLYGYERFFTYLAHMQPDLDRVYNPLLTVNP
jgi:hypothetical protein